MENNQLYENLAKHLDQGIVGAPTSHALLDILRILFPPEEARVALKLTMQNQTLSELMVSFPDFGDSLEEVLNRMAGQGTVFTSQRPGAERKYALLPSVVGWAETPFWAGKETERTRKLAPLWLKYREEAFGAELSRGDMPVVRVLPVSKQLRESSEILPYNALETMVEAQSFCAVAHCPCRQMHAQVGDVCDHSLENCLHFGSMGRYMVEQGLARRISADETLRILKEANEEGLVHAVENIEGHLGTICNCCGCCCVFLETKSKMGLHTISSSSYVAQVDPELCVACGTCEERCPMGAIAVGDDDIAVVSENICIGCGVCTPTCDPEAVELTLRAEAKPPPDLSEFLTVRYKEESA
ncbi:MAG: 4Fe-4S binding protein [Proteobacteria bacterium]|nr:4Fe-4S binding protein [Pseudomonadota bacterium]